MSELPEHLRSTPGDPGQWNQAWEGIANHDAQLFARGRPRTLRQFCQRAYFEDLWAMLGKRAPDARCLELGSGRGTTSMYLASRGCQVTLVDLAPEAFRVAEANFRHEALPPPTFVTADVRDTHLPSGAYHCIYNIGLLEHFEDPVPVLVEAMRLLAPGGLLFMVIVPAIPATRRWLSYLLLAPWRVVLEPAKALAKRMLGRRRRSAITRMTFPDGQWVAWLAGLGATDCGCVPYNPYHAITPSRLFERLAVLPVYSCHYAVNRSRRPAPVLKTWRSIAACQLLTARKPE